MFIHKLGQVDFVGFNKSLLKNESILRARYNRKIFSWESKWQLIY